MSGATSGAETADLPDHLDSPPKTRNILCDRQFPNSSTQLDI